MGWSDFARHYSRNHGCFLFLWVLRWFTSPGSLRYPMYSDNGNRCSHRLGFPIRTSPDHSLLAASRGFSQLTTSFIAFLRQGIPTHALSSLTIKSILNTECSSCALAFHPSGCPGGRLAYLCFSMPVSIQLSKIKLVLSKEARSRRSVLADQRLPSPFRRRAPESRA